jgi:hypothetical protein
LVEADGATLSQVQYISPVPNGAPPPFIPPFLLSFQATIAGQSSGPVLVRILVPAGEFFPTYLKYGHERAGDSPHWYQFIYNPSDPNSTGAEFRTDPRTGQQVIVLHLIDGAVGDEDLTPNGVIIDPGAPAAFTDPARNFVAALYEDVLGRGPSDAEMAQWVSRLDKGDSRIRLAQAVWNSTEHRRLQVEAWSTRFLGHLPGTRQEAQWVNLLRRGRGEIAVEASILTSPDYRHAHPTTASFVAGLAHDVLGQAVDPIDPAHSRARGPSKSSLAALARKFLTAPGAAAILAQQDATSFLGRPATTQEAHAALVSLRRDPMAPTRLAERILASDAFYQFVNSALPAESAPSGPGRHAHKTTQHRKHH